MAEKILTLEQFKKNFEWKGRQRARYSDIESRWNSRVVANGWDKRGAEGAKLYLARYGNEIGCEKLAALAYLAEANHRKEMAQVFWEKSYETYYGVKATPSKPKPVKDKPKFKLAPIDL